MLLEEVKQIVLDIQKQKNDDESAHCLEDELYEDFVRHIASLDIEQSEMAKEVLKTKDIDFARWCA